MHKFLPLISVLFITNSFAQINDPNWSEVEAETLQHFRALLQFDTSDPPGRELPAAEYLRDVLEAEGIPVEMLYNDPQRPNVLARLEGNGTKEPLLIMAHTDVVNVDPEKWIFPPFSATVDNGYVYGRGAVDDKDNLASALMVMLELQRQNVPLERDVIFLAESGEEGATEYGIEFMVNEHFDKIDAEFCLAEGGSVARVNREVQYAGIQTVEKLPYRVELVATGVAGHGSVPLQSNSVTRLAKAIAAIADWRTPIRLNETTATYFERLASISPNDAAERYLNVLDPGRASDSDEYFLANEPRHASMLRSSLSPNIFDAGYRINVIPSEARASVDFRALPDEDIAEFMEEIRRIVNDPVVDVSLGQRNTRPPGQSSLNTEAFAAIEAGISEHYGVITLPTMSTGATDMAYLRNRGIQCYGIGPAIDREDAALGFGAHSDQERILISELNRFVRFNWDLVIELAAEQ
ncbi:MAG TPA: M20/M25/M40 family metallo-hydrolase [Gammaproteobacteria bacterium]|jgi:acetylornithine deacetylase/succinyl-diaminopimelate desuccinylase-like protein|nr:M20/M25/M40 family metallo-hydrolase [Gammaproteobacteria bacterium]|tara:strand:- start:36927 stop:38324 length:1398 start_codon:yes stop_codon:yes gene_type:complete